MDYLLPIAVLTVASWVLVGALRGWIRRRGILDVPNHRSSHTRPTPRGGGIAIAGICIVGFAGYWFYRPVCPGPIVLGYCIGGAMIAAVSWLDDVRGCSVFVRFAVHGAAAVLLLLGCGMSTTAAGAVPTSGNVLLAWFALPIALLWIVGLTNAYNFMDGIDGIAGAQAVVAGLGWLILGSLTGQPVLGVLGLLVAAGSLGFLPHNWPPARIFMGDVGSALLGFTLATLAVLATRADPRLAVAGVLLVWPFIFDTTVTFLRRLSRGENVFAAHRSHLYQRLVRAGWSHGSVSSLYAGLAVLGLVLAILVVARPVLGDWLAAVLLPLAAVALWLLVRRVESRRPTGVSTGRTEGLPSCEEQPPRTNG